MFSLCADNTCVSLGFLAVCSWLFDRFAGETRSINVTEIAHVLVESKIKPMSCRMGHRRAWLQCVQCCCVAYSPSPVTNSHDFHQPAPLRSFSWRRSSTSAPSSTRTSRSARRPCPVRTEDRDARPACGSGEGQALDSAINTTHAIDSSIGEWFCGACRLVRPSPVFFVTPFPPFETACETARGDANLGRARG